jgi:hypothetical protein
LTDKESKQVLGFVAKHAESAGIPYVLLIQLDL